MYADSHDGKEGKVTLLSNHSVTFVLSYFLITRLMSISPGFVCVNLLTLMDVQAVHCQ